MELSVWLALTILFMSGGLTPGPAVMLVTMSSMRFGFGPAMMAALGIAAANIVWISLASLGVAALAARFPLAFTAVKFAGLAFILWLAIDLVRHSGGWNVTSEAPPRRSTLFARGVGLQMANPNALVFFGGLLPAHFDASRPLALQVAIVIVTVTVTELLGLTIYAGAADRLSAQLARPGFARVFNAMAALLMVGAASYAVFATLH